MRFVIEKVVEMQVPASVVWKVVRDVEAYAQWNPFCVECRSTLQPGSPIDMQVQLGSRLQAQREWMQTYDEGRGFSYTMKPVPLGALSSLRLHEITAIDATRCRYRSYFHLQGWLKPLVLALLRRQLEDGFAAMTAALQVRAEAQWIHQQTQAGGG
ncbi:SRPBCC family protein [Solimonas marina]|uniref:SRPBCC domain-containing protein n=1 Tax=Solimonas marina TaxID=2714601 RepID=A0A970B884_9GAMM|nr:SRPBCC domain-containing protein [Solimonas marina]